MGTKEWERLEELFHATLQLEAADRERYLLRECSGDEELRREVESLIAASENTPNFIETPALTLGMRVLSNGIPESFVGQSIGHYKIIRLLGRGGMGDVYLAEDSKLQRQVALKFIGNAFIDNEWAREQLIAEARAVAKLENPNICTVHGFEEVGGYNFIVMQFVEGESLGSLLRRGPLTVEQALDFAEQISSALAAAHVRGIIHRDIKPQNMIVTEEGQVKVLDFGLAKFVQQNRNAENPGVAQNQTSHLGLLVGTVDYMSPEQTQGEELDGRTDLFSFGVVLYEMLGGTNPFSRTTNQETLVAINEQEPAWSLRGVPERLIKIIRRCLAKDRTERFATTEELLVAIRSLREKQRHSAAAYLHAIRRHRHFSKYAVASLALFLCVLAVAGFVYAKLSKTHTLAVVPITNLSTDSTLDYLSTGLTRSLYDKFSYLPRLKVRFPTEIPSKQTEDILRAGRELKVESVLAGEMLKEGESLLLRVRVFNTADGALRLEHTFRIDPSDMFSLQDDITRRVTEALDLWLIGNEKKLLTKRQTNNEDALRLYMRGRGYLGLKRDRENIKAAIDSFQQAVDLDPSFARAYAGLADCYALRGNVLYGPMRAKDTMDRARYNAQQALDIDYSLPEAHASMGVIKLKYDWDWPQAEQEFKLALALNPEYAPAHYWYSQLLVVLGRFDEAIRESERARDLDPYSPLAAMNYGRAFYFARRYQESADYFGKLLEEKPEYKQYLHVRALALLQLRLYDDAIKTLETLHRIDPLHAAAALGFAYGKNGRPEDALKMIRELDEFARQGPALPHEKAFVSIGIGETTEAFRLLDEAYQERFEGLAYLTTDPIYDDLRSDPRFADLARRINLSP